MDGKLDGHQAGDVNIFILAEPVRVLAEEGQYSHRQLQKSVGEDIKVQLLMLESYSCFRILLRVAGSVKRVNSGFVDGDVVGVAVAADRVEGNHYFRLEFTEYLDQATSNLLKRGRRQRFRMAVILRAGHTGIAIAKVDDTRQSEHFSGALKLSPTYIAGSSTTLKQFGTDCADLAAGSRDIIDPDTGGSILCQGASDTEGFIIRMPADKNQRSLVVHNIFTCCQPLLRL